MIKKGLPLKCKNGSPLNNLLIYLSSFKKDGGKENTAISIDANCFRLNIKPILI